MSDNRETENKEFLQHLQSKLAASRQALRLEEITGRMVRDSSSDTDDDSQDGE